MNYRFYDINATDDVLKPVSLQRLAAHVVTDWIPGVPQPAAAGFANILGTMLEPYLTDDSATWCIAPEVASFERQWRIATSWIFGVALCREVMEDFGYHCWAPVSAFVGARRTAGSAWTMRLPTQKCSIERPSPPTSRFLPDYLAFRELPGSHDVAVAFFESKGTEVAIAGRDLPPTTWRDQVKNAEFSYEGTVFAPERRIIVATRVNPSAKRMGTRRLVIRAWNGRADVLALPTAAACDLVVLHYYSLCKALRLEGTASALALSEGFSEDPETQENMRSDHKEASALLEEEKRFRLQTFPLGHQRLTIKLGEFGNEALALLTSLDRGREKEIRDLLSQITKRGRSMERTTAREFERPDGVEVSVE